MKLVIDKKIKTILSLILVFAIVFITIPNFVFGAKQKFDRHTVTIIGGTNNNKATTATYKTEENVMITADGHEPDGKVFSHWSADSDDVHFADEDEIETCFAMPDEDITITAIFKSQHIMTIIGGTNNNKATSAKYKTEENVMITADGHEPAGKVFSHWSADSDDVHFADEDEIETCFAMPDEDVTITANFISVKKYTLTLKNAEIVGKHTGTSFAEGTRITISAIEPKEPPEKGAWDFLEWDCDEDIDFENGNLRETSFVMPDEDITIEAEFYGLYGEEQDPDDDDLDDSDDDSDDSDDDTDDSDDDTENSEDKHTVTIVGGTNNNKVTSATYKTEENVIITADGYEPKGKVFSHWSADEDVIFADENSIETSFAMPDEDVTITANFQNEYKIADNKTNKIKIKENKNISFRIDADFDKFEDLYINGKLIDKKNYTAKEGSVIITLKEDFAETIPTGTNNIAVKFTDGVSNVELEIEDNSNSFMIPIIIFSILAVIAIGVGAFFIIKKHNINKQYK